MKIVNVVVKEVLALDAEENIVQATKRHVSLLETKSWLAINTVQSIGVKNDS